MSNASLKLTVISNVFQLDFAAAEYGVRGPTLIHYSVAIGHSAFKWTFFYCYGARLAAWHKSYIICIYVSCQGDFNAENLIQNARKCTCAGQGSYHWSQIGWGKKGKVSHWFTIIKCSSFRIKKGKWFCSFRWCCRSMTESSKEWELTNFIQISIHKGTWITYTLDTAKFGSIFAWIFSIQHFGYVQGAVDITKLHICKKSTTPLDFKN